MTVCYGVVVGMTVSKIEAGEAGFESAKQAEFSIRMALAARL